MQEFGKFLRVLFPMRFRDVVKRRNRHAGTRLAPAMLIIHFAGVIDKIRAQTLIGRRIKLAGGDTIFTHVAGERYEKPWLHILAVEGESLTSAARSNVFINFAGHHLPE